MRFVEHIKRLCWIPVLAVIAGPAIGVTVGDEPRTRSGREPSENTVELATRYGAVAVDRGECETADYGRLREWLELGYEAALEQNPAVAELSIDDITIIGEVDPHANGGIRADGYYRSKHRLIVYRCGLEQVVRHELLHHFCHALDLSCGDRGCKAIDHPGGHKLNCEPIPK